MAEEEIAISIFIPMIVVFYLIFFVFNDDDEKTTKTVDGKKIPVEAKPCPRCPDGNLYELNNNIYRCDRCKFETYDWRRDYGLT